MSTLSIKTKIILATTLVFGIVFSGFSVVIYQRVKSAYVERLDARLEGQAEKIREEVEEQYLEKRFPNESDLRSLKTEGLPDPLIRLTDSVGSVIFGDSLLQSWPMKSWKEVEGHEFTFEERAIAQHRYRCLWAPVEANDRDQYAVQIAVSLREVEAGLALLQLLLIIGVPVALLIAAVAVYAIVTVAFQPLSAMVAATERISPLNLGERLGPPKTHDEVFKLAATFNTMMERIESAFKGQKQFVADASHEIRTPLTIIQSELEYAQKHFSELSSQESVEAALEEVDRLKKISDDLLLLAKLESPSMNLSIQSVRIDEVLTDCVKRMKPVADKRTVSLRLEICEALEIKGDEDKLRSGVLNLIDNAIKYSKEGGGVTVALSRSGKKVVVSVCDGGEGIGEADRLNIFERFHRSESSRLTHGSGLGLAIVRRIVELHKGEISVESQPGKGSTFAISLPSGE